MCKISVGRANGDMYSLHVLTPLATEDAPTPHSESAGVAGSGEHLVSILSTSAGTIGGQRVDDIRVSYREHGTDHEVTVRLFDGDVTFHDGHEPDDLDLWWACHEAACEEAGL